MLDLSTLKKKIMELAEQTKLASEEAHSIAAKANSRITMGNVRTMTLLEVVALIEESELGDTTLESLAEEFEEEILPKLSEDEVNQVMTEAQDITREELKSKAEPKEAVSRPVQ